MNLKTYIRKFYLTLLENVRQSWHSPLASLAILPIHTSPLETPWIKIGKLIDKFWITRLLWRLNFTVCQTTLNMIEMVWADLSNANRHIKYVDQMVKTTAAKHEDKLSFTKALIVNPRATGAAIPSSRRLAREMAVHVMVDQPGMVIELGAGTGVVTAALLEHGVDPARIIAVELVPELAKKLQIRFPEIKVIEGDATCLQTLLAGYHEINAVVSSLPLRSLPKPVTQAILTQIDHILPKRGRYIQFTYSYRANRFAVLRDYQPVSSKRIWINMPPARVDAVEK